MLVVFSPIFVADTKLIFRYNFVVPLMKVYDIVPKYIEMTQLFIYRVFKIPWKSGVSTIWR